MQLVEFFPFVLPTVHGRQDARTFYVVDNNFKESFGETQPTGLTLTALMASLSFHFAETCQLTDVSRLTAIDLLPGVHHSLQS
jgi:hypothetical protein